MKIDIKFLLILLTIGLTRCQHKVQEIQDARPNVLFIAIDDLRPELGCYSAPVKSPNIDKLASEGVLFNRHYVQFAVCIPSRAALLTGLRSERTRQLYGPPVWKDVPGVQSWGNTFNEAGYQTASLGKIWHITGGENSDKFDIEWKPHYKYTYAEPKSQKDWINFRELRSKNVPVREIENLCPITEAADVHDSAYVDGKVALRAIKEMRKLAKNDQPFMMAVGFVKPHLPLNAPKKYWDMYKEEEIELAPNPDFPQNMPDIAFSGHPNFFNYTYGDYPALEKGKPMDIRTSKHLRHAYRAATSYSDAQVGLILKELTSLGLDKNTIVVLWGDHGWHLGDAGHWGKQTNFEYATRAPLIIKVPEFKNKNVKTDALVETVDIMPTVMDLCGIPAAKISDGKSLVPFLENPTPSWKEAVYHVFNRRKEIDGKRTLIIGHAVRTNKYRFISWRVGWGLQGKEIAAELYDYEKDPYETINVANEPDYQEIKKQMESLLQKGPPGEI
ncbi:MAG: sulfatase [Bacteroidota bacterium]